MKSEKSSTIPKNPKIRAGNAFFSGKIDENKRAQEESLKVENFYNTEQIIIHITQDRLKDILKENHFGKYIDLVGLTGLSVGLFIAAIDQSLNNYHDLFLGGFIVSLIPLCYASIKNFHHWKNGGIDNILDEIKGVK